MRNILDTWGKRNKEDWDFHNVAKIKQITKSEFQDCNFLKTVYQQLDSDYKKSQVNKSGDEIDNKTPKRKDIDAL